MWYTTSTQQNFCLTQFLLCLHHLTPPPPHPPNLSEEREKQFLSQLLDSKDVESYYSMRVPVVAVWPGWGSWTSTDYMGCFVAMWSWARLQFICMLASDNRSWAEHEYEDQSLVDISIVLECCWWSLCYDKQVRLLSTDTFATVVHLTTLDGGLSEPENLSEEMKMKKEREKQPLSQLLNSRNVENCSMDIPTAAELSYYQVAGMNWLGFLYKYRLHGTLCDDMGLGKTLQPICILASDHRNLAGNGAQSLVVWPATLRGIEEVSNEDLFYY